ncbi:MAG: DNA mismatch repair protein [Rikenellaceae bacterium]
MKFAIDKQTLEDLNLLGRYKTNSIYNLYNHTVTRGGGLILEQMFLNPLTNATEINARKTVFSFFQQENFAFPFSKAEFDLTEHYLENIDSKSIIFSALKNIRRKAAKLIANDKEFDLLQDGLAGTITLLKKFEVFVRNLSEVANSKISRSVPYYGSVEKIIGILHDKKLSWIYTFNENNKITFWQLALCDHKLRYSNSDFLKEIIRFLHNLDVYIAVSDIGKKRGFVYANAFDADKLSVDIKGIYHPCIPNAIANDIHLDNNSNVLFLTGANMAGKSTLMKSFGISVYLAHMGFPLAARSMDFNVQQGIYTSINVPDNLNMGYSHFYAEVVRVKKIATEVASGKNLIIMFDELFKGTNVKDAYDATVAITEAFSRIHECAFIVSTHIMEAGITLKERCNNIMFKYLPTTLKGSVPSYPYILDNGISNDRHGMMIINNEKIIEIIRR